MRRIEMLKIASQLGQHQWVARTIVAILALGLLPHAPVQATTGVSWDRVANVKDAAAKIGELQAQSGVEQAFRFISACYKTHGLASTYSKAFEGCIAQDYIVSKTLIEIYTRVPADALGKMGAPSAEQIDASFKQRAANAFGQYNRPPEDALALRGVIEEVGVPAFMKAAFPPKDAPAKP